MKPNLDPSVVDGFGDEWTRFDQSGLTPDDLNEMFDSYFHIFPWNALPENAEGFDAGCGSGRWALIVAPRVGLLHCIDASSAALEVARRTLQNQANVRFHVASVDAIPLRDESADFGYSLGVLHHIPDTADGVMNCVRKLKPGAPFLLYLYYRFDNRPRWYSMLWRSTEPFRFAISRLPYAIRFAVSQMLAAMVYWPAARFGRLLEIAGFTAKHMPLAYYRKRSFYVMRTDALDRFGTRLEQRFKRDEIQAMMERAGLERIAFSESAPFWCAVGYRRK